MAVEQQELIPQPEKRPALVAFGRFVKPEMYDVFGDYDLSAVNEAERAWMNPDNLSGPLFSPAKDEKTLAVDSIGLNAYEFGILVRSPESLGRSAVSRVLGANDIDEERLAASERGRIHAFENKYEKMTEHAQKLRERRSEIRELYREAKKPGYAHNTEEWMKQHLSAAWQEFQIILDVAHTQRGWTDEKRQRAQAALISRLTQGSQRDRVKHWQEMLELTNNYLGARITLFSNRIRQVGKELPS